MVSFVILPLPPLFNLPLLLAYPLHGIWVNLSLSQIEILLTTSPFLPLPPLALLDI